MSLSSSLPDLGKHIKSAREGRGWTQRDLAKNAGVSSGVVAKVETGGTARAETTDKILAALDLCAEITLQRARPVLEQALPVQAA